MDSLLHGILSTSYTEQGEETFSEVKFGVGLNNRVQSVAASGGVQVSLGALIG